MKASKLDRHGNVEIAFNTQNEAILSPHGSLKLLPCEVCLELEWKRLAVVSFLCSDCSQARAKDEGFATCPSCGKPLRVKRFDNSLKARHLEGYLAYCAHGPCQSFAANDGQFGKDPKQAIANLQRAVEIEEEKRQCK